MDRNNVPLSCFYIATGEAFKGRGNRYQLGVGQRYSSTERMKSIIYNLEVKLFIDLGGNRGREIKKAFQERLMYERKLGTIPLNGFIDYKTFFGVLTHLLEPEYDDMVKLIDKNTTDDLGSNYFRLKEIHEEETFNRHTGEESKSFSVHDIPFEVSFMYNVALFMNKLPTK